MTKFKIFDATSQTDVETIVQLANEIWHDHYLPIIGAKQVKYMLEHFQNTAAINEQLKNGYRYFLLKQNDTALGYFSVVQAQNDAASIHISKLYVRTAWQRKGLGSQMLAYVESHCDRRGIKQIWLTVNRDNKQAIDFYRSKRFVNAGTWVQEIGGGFVMDDFKMVKNL
ncbi:MAG: GNAT family N-acetyltransferase [Gammaproteobacteria bacterium]